MRAVAKAMRNNLDAALSKLFNELSQPDNLLSRVGFIQTQAYILPGDNCTELWSNTNAILVELRYQ